MLYGGRKNRGDDIASGSHSFKDFSAFAEMIKSVIHILYRKWWKVENMLETFLILDIRYEDIVKINDAK